MDSIFILIPIALIFVAIAIAAFLWAVNNKQYDDLDSPAQSILFEDSPALSTEHKPSVDQGESPK